MLKSSVCRQVDLDTSIFLDWTERMREAPQYHRKLWEWCYIAQALHERDMLRPGRRGLGFAVGQEPLASLFAQVGCEIVGTDMDMSNAADPSAAKWLTTQEYATTVDALNVRGICPPAEFSQRVSFRYVDMNAVPDDLTGFDFLWSACAVEHVGSLAMSIAAVKNMVKCLKPGGVAVHTTEYNVLSNTRTVEDGWSVVWRKRDLEELKSSLQAVGHHVVDLDLESGTRFADYFVDEPPYTQVPHLKLRLLGQIVTSVGIIIEAAQVAEQG